MTTQEYVFHDENDADEITRRVQNNFGFSFLRAYVYGTDRLWSFRAVFWLILAGACVLAAPRCPAPSRRFVTALGLSSLIYLATYFFVGVASNFRYTYWPVLATGVAWIIVVCEAIAAGRRSPRLKG